ncbi:Uncharacterised protein [Klebsiella pneumoniae]|nr:Uncharacterised protein [Klebsiella pneumoniae]
MVHRGIWIKCTPMNIKFTPYLFWHIKSNFFAEWPLGVIYKYISNIQCLSNKKPHKHIELYITIYNLI